MTLGIHVLSTVNLSALADFSCTCCSNLSADQLRASGFCKCNQSPTISLLSVPATLLTVGLTYLARSSQVVDLLQLSTAFAMNAYPDDSAKVLQRRLQPLLCCKMGWNITYPSRSRLRICRIETL